VEIIGILRLLERHRLAVLLGLPLAALIGLTMVYQVSLFPPGLASRQTTSVAAAQRVLIAAPDQPTFGLDAITHGTLGTLPSRAILIADMLSADAVSDEIARAVGIDPKQLTVLGPAMGKPPLEIALAEAATEAAAAPTGPYLLMASADGHIPIISLTASAPDNATALRLTAAATTSIRRIIKARSGTTAPLSAEPLGVPFSKAIVDGPHKSMGLGAALVFFIFWCSAITLISGLAARRRTRLPDAAWAPTAR
jgi:hypothetical protein